MGMENDNHVTMTWAEMQELAAKEKAEAEARAKEIDPRYVAICPFINREKKTKLLLIDKDRKFYTLNLIRYEQLDPRNNSPEVPVWTKDPIPIDENDLVDVFGK